jgi:nucleoside-diphosphate-sugar epimerase
VRGDLTQLDDLLDATRDVEAVCHLGGVGDVYLALEQPQLAAAHNVLGTANVMEACLRNGVQKVVYASTWEVYGLPQYEPIDEQHPCRPDHPYNITKLAGEQIVLSYDRLKGLQAIALRLGTAYGAAMRPNAVIPMFIRKALVGEPLIIKGSGEQWRQFTHARDLARAFALAIESPLHGEALNVLSDERVSVKQLAELVARRLPVEIVYQEARPGDIPSASVSSDRARQSLGWAARIPFREGLSELIDEALDL